MELTPQDVRDRDPATGVVLTGEGELYAPSVAAEVPKDPKQPAVPHPVEFDIFSRPETAQLAARVSVQANMVLYESR